MYHGRKALKRLPTGSRVLKGDYLFQVVVIVICLLATGVVTAQISNPFARAKTEVNADTAKTADDGKLVVEGKATLIAFEKDSSIREGLRILAAMYEKNIVPSAKVDGVLGFTRLRDVTFEQAMDALLGTNFMYEDEDNIIKVYTTEEYKKIKADVDRMTWKVFTLYYMSAAEASKLITPVMSGAGTIQASTPAETVVPTGESISGGANGGDSMALNDHIIVKDYPENIAEVERLLKELDVRPKQVLVEATILSATLNENTKFGIQWDSLSGVSMTGAVSVTPTKGLNIGIVEEHAYAFIEALEKITDTTILANPKILAVNKQLGQVYIGQKIGYISQTTQTQTSTSSQVEFLDTGTKLSFRPYIGEDGYIRMDIHPKDSTGTLKNNSIPDEYSTEIATNIFVKDGQTIVIGGLFRDKTISSRDQVPLLGNLPFLGALFRTVTDTTERQEVIVLLTPRIIDDPNQTKGDLAAEEIERKQAGVRENLQVIGRRSNMEMLYDKAAAAYLDGDMEESMKNLDKVLALCPTNPEALRLKERIMAETDPAAYKRLDRIVRDEVLSQCPADQVQ